MYVRLTASTTIATINVEKPSAKDIASKSKRKKIVVKRPKKRTIFRTNKPIPAFIRPLLASGVRTHATPKLTKKKLIPIKTPPRTRALGSSQRVWPRTASSAHSKIPCQISIPAIVLFAAVSILFRRENLHPAHQSHKRSNKSGYRTDDQQPRGGAQVTIGKISD